MLVERCEDHPWYTGTAGKPGDVRPVHALDLPAPNAQCRWCWELFRRAHE